MKYIGKMAETALTSSPLFKWMSYNYKVNSDHNFTTEVSEDTFFNIGTKVTPFFLLTVFPCSLCKLLQISI
jgi:hypothetical protein